MQTTYLDPLVIAKISKLWLRARTVVEGMLTGLHQSPYKGWSQEFAQHREYSPGDELRYLDWKVYGRTDRHYVKQFEEETNLRAYILLDCSRSMDYGKEQTHKFTYAAGLAIALAYLMLKQQDAAGLVTFNNTLNHYLPPRNHLAHINVILNHLGTITPQGETNLVSVLHDFGQYLKRRGLIILISDLYSSEPPEEIIRSLKYFRYKKHELIVFHLVHPTELELPSGDSLLIENMETGETLQVEPALIREEYQRILKEMFTTYELQFRDNAIDYTLIHTNTPLDYVLGKYLSYRQKVQK